MNKTCLLILTFLSFLSMDNVAAETDTLSLTDITGGKFTPKYISGIRPMVGADTYSRISDDKKRIETYYYRNCKLCKVLFDMDKAKGDSIKEFDDYSISPDGTKIILRTDCRNVYRRSNKARYYVYDHKNNRVSLLVNSNEVQNPVWSNNGKMIAYVVANNIYLKKLEGRGDDILQVTNDGLKNKIINGIPDWVYEEEFSTAGSLCFTPDDSAICWLRYDESLVPVYCLQVLDDGKNIHSPFTETKDGFYSYKYPQAGEKNSDVTAWSFDIATATTRQFNMPLDKDGYVPRLLPMGQKDYVCLVTLNRHQDSLCVYQANPRDGKCRLVINQQGDRYFKEMVITDLKIENGHLIIPNDIGEYVSVDVYDLSQIERLNTLETLKPVRNVALKGYDIVSVYGMDKMGGIYYQAAFPTPMDRNVFRDDNDITGKSGCSSARFSGDYNYFVKTWSDASTPYVFSISDNNGKDVRILEDNKTLRDELAKYNLPKMVFFSFTTADGIQLNGWRINPHPSSLNPQPVILHQYSGPGSQQVINAWYVGSMGNGALFDKYLAKKGFVVACVDGRGTGGRGTQFEKQIYKKLGQMECHDQIETAKWIARQNDIDPHRIGIWGWSYGGFNSLMCLTDTSAVFRCGVAIAPPTSWRYYDSVYTERYMRTPKENPEGYDVCPLSRAKDLNSQLLIIHGLADDNVHPQNTLEFSEALVQADKDFRQQLYTNRNHSIRGDNTRQHLLRLVTEWFETNLGQNGK